MTLLYTVNEVRYFYLGLESLGLLGGESVPEEKLDELIRAELNRFNDARNRRYSLRSRVYEFGQTPRIILAELKQYGLVRVEGRGGGKIWSLTDEGWRLYRMQQSPNNRLKLRAEYAVIHVNTFPTIFRGLLETLEASPSGMIGIPRISRAELAEIPPETAAESVADRACAVMHDYFAEGATVYVPLRDYLTKVVADACAEGKPLATVLEHAVAQFYVRRNFAFIYSKARFSMIRDRSWFLGLTSYYRVGKASAGVEIIYPVARLSSAPAEPGWQRLPLVSGHLHLRHPTWEADSHCFLSALAQAYATTPRGIGYANVADLRDRVCFALRWPDYLFDEFLQKAIHNTQNNTSPLYVYVDSSLGTTMPLMKRAPLEFGDKAFNLVRVVPATGGTSL